MGFTYTATLVCLHESDLRNIELFDLDVFDDAELLGWKLQLESGFVSDDVVVEYIGEHNGIDLGYGLFSSTTIIAGTFIGEYTGLLHSTRRYTPTTSMASRYAANYPSCDGGFEVDASEFGNVIRFINHSSTPNAQFRSVLLDGLAHIVCVRITYSALIGCIWVYNLDRVCVGKPSRNFSWNPAHGRLRPMLLDRSRCGTR